MREITIIIKNLNIDCSRAPSRVRDSAPVSLSDLQQPTRKQLSSQFERDPIAALLALAINSGLNRFSATSELYGTGNMVDSTKDTVREAIARLEAEMIASFEDADGRDSRERIVNDFLKSVNLIAPLFACACCGIREFKSGSEDSPLCVDVPLWKLSKLHLTKCQVDDLIAIPEIYRPIVSHFKSRTGIWFHLHPEFVTVEQDQVILNIYFKFLLYLFSNYQINFKK